MLGRWLGERDPLVRACARRSAVALGTTEETAARLQALEAECVQTLPVVALSDNDLAKLSNSATNGKNLKVLSVGTLAALKGFHLGIEAFSRADIPNAHYAIVGAGPERARLRSLIERLGVSDRVDLYGQISREQVLRLMAECDLFLHPSLQDSGGMVCLEAMAAAKPVVCIDLGGPAQLTDQSCAIRVAPTDIEQTIDGLSDALRDLAADRDLRIRMGEAGRKRIHDRFRWRITARAISEFYELALAMDNEEVQEAVRPGQSATV